MPMPKNPHTILKLVLEHLSDAEQTLTMGYHTGPARTMRQCRGLVAHAMLNVTRAEKARERAAKREAKRVRHSKSSE